MEHRSEAAGQKENPFIGILPEQVFTFLLVVVQT